MNVIAWQHTWINKMCFKGSNTTRKLKGHKKFLVWLQHFQQKPLQIHVNVWSTSKAVLWGTHWRPYIGSYTEAVQKAHPQPLRLPPDLCSWSRMLLLFWSPCFPTPLHSSTHYTGSLLQFASRSRLVLHGQTLHSGATTVVLCLWTSAPLVF